MSKDRLVVSRSRHCKALLCFTAVFVLLISITLSFGQKTSAIDSGMYGNDEIQGKVFLPPGDTSGVRPLVKLQSLRSPEVIGVTDQNGSFRFTHLRPDHYTVIVDAGGEYEKATDTVSIAMSGSVPAQGDAISHAIPLVYQVEFYLKRKQAAAATTSSAAYHEIPAAEIPAAARELFDQARKSSRAGDHAKAAELLRFAISQAPQFTLAYNELASQYLKTGEGEKAVQTLGQAVAIDPDDLGLLVNYGVALLDQKQFTEAEAQLRSAVQKRPDSTPANYYLGMALISQKKMDEARAAFEAAIRNGGQKLALAHRALAGIYLQMKQDRKAADELETYLKLEPKTADADKIRQTIKELRRHS